MEKYTIYNYDFPLCFNSFDGVLISELSENKYIFEICMLCYYKTSCMRGVLDKFTKLNVKQRELGKTKDFGIVNFFRRWSERKMINKK